MALPTRSGRSFSSLAGASRVVVARTLVGAVAAESQGRTIANFALTQAFNAAAYDSLLVGVEYGSGGDTITLEPLALDREGQRWLQLRAGGVVVKTSALVPGQLEEVSVFGSMVMLRVDAVGAGGPTDLNILAAPGKRRFGL